MLKTLFSYFLAFTQKYSRLAGMKWWWKSLGPGSHMTSHHGHWSLNEIMSKSRILNLWLHWWGRYNIFSTQCTWSELSYHWNVSSSLVIRKCQHNFKNQLVQFVLPNRYNDYTHDPLSRCNCTPPYSGENAISARSDLNPANGTYPFSALGHRSHGGMDMKVLITFKECVPWHAHIHYQICKLGLILPHYSGGHKKLIIRYCLRTKWDYQGGTTATFLFVWKVCFNATLTSRGQQSV